MFRRLRATGRIVIITFLVWFVTDQSIRIFNIASVMPAHFNRQNEQRQPAPYIEFKGAPGRLDHDRYGYRWVPDTVEAGALKIAFFGGSTGYNGDPPIASLIERIRLFCTNYDGYRSPTSRSFPRTTGSTCTIFSRAGACSSRTW